MTAYAKGGQMDNIKFGPGTIFERDIDGNFIKFGDVSSIELSPVETETVDHELAGPLMVASSQTITIDFKLNRRQIEALYDIAMGLADKIYSFCPNKQVVHMAKHGNKARTRKKNRSRAIRIIERRCNR